MGLLLAGTEPAGAGPVAASVLVDLALVGLLAVPLVLGANGVVDRALGAWLAVCVAVLVFAVLGACWASTGRTPGGVVAGLRWVDALTGTVPGGLRLRGTTPVALSGRDPRQPVPAVPLVPLDEVPAVVPDAPPVPPRRLQHRAIALVAADERVEIASTALLGRNPVVAEGDAVAETVRVMDLTRSVSKTHARLSWDGSRLDVEDLGSTNGTSIVTADGRRLLCSPGQPVQAVAGDTLCIGERAYALDLPVPQRTFEAALGEVQSASRR